MKNMRCKFLIMATLLSVMIILSACENNNLNGSSSIGLAMIAYLLDSSISKDQGQFWSSNFYEVGTIGGANAAFGVNHATGHIKAYPSDTTGPMAKHVRAVRSISISNSYGNNDFADNGDGTVTDRATGLMWAAQDYGTAVDWENALSVAENSEVAGYTDWRLPDVKELQSIVDYSGSYPAIDQAYFTLTPLDDNPNYYFWTSTSAYFSTYSPGYGYAWYVAFGYAVGDDGNDSHGAGAVRFSPKYTGSSFTGEGGDNILNSVLFVRNTSSADKSFAIIDAMQIVSYDNNGNIITPVSGESFYGQDAQYDGIHPSFTDNGDGTITDNTTGLMWQQDPSDDKYSWSEASAYCDSLSLAGYTDWRLPTVKELFSISNFQSGWPYLDAVYFKFPKASMASGPGGSPQ